MLNGGMRYHFSALLGCFIGPVWGVDIVAVILAWNGGMRYRFSTLRPPTLVVLLAGIRCKILGMTYTLLMPNYLRYRIPGGCYFFTVNLLERNNTLLIDHIDLLRESVRMCKQKRPFHIDAWVVLPDHMHCIWTLPEGDDDFSNRWKVIKTHFSKGLPKSERRTRVRIKRGERGIWQRRFWEHAIRDDRDYEKHMDYLHFNPVKHGYVEKVIDWPFSSFHRHVKKGTYFSDWASDEQNDFEMGET